MTTQVLIVHGQLPFAIKLKQALERGAQFEAHPFTSFEAALDYMREHVQDVAVIDFGRTGLPGERIVQQLRSIQPEVGVIAVPKLDEARVRALGILASLDASFSPRELIDLIDAYFANRERPSYQNESGTAILSQSSAEEHSSPAPDALPDYSSLDDILAVSGTNIFEQPPVEGDTPSSSPAPLAWEEPSKPESSFDDVLNALPSNSPDAAAPSNPFTDLVNSMRSEEEHRPLPSRQQQLVEFILSGGSESLLEPEEPEAAPPPAPAPTPAEPPKQGLLSAFERLAREEPPPPGFEESGTVGDLVNGVQDRSFRNVLSILAGEEVNENEPPEEEIAPPTSADFNVGPRSKQPNAETSLPRSSEIYVFDDKEPTPARVILQRTLEQSLAGGTFSLEELLASIDEQLPLHRPKVQPLPSWVRDQQRTQDDAFLVREPDFLPEELPEEPTPSEYMYPDQTTQAARGQQIEQHPEALETEWLESPPRITGETLNLPDTLPEEIPAEATIPHQATVPSEPTVLHEFAEAPAEAFEWEALVVSSETEASEAADEAFAWEEPAASIEADAEPAVEESEHGFDWEALAIREAEDEGLAWEEPVVSEETPYIEKEPELWHNLPEQDFNTQFEMMAAFEVHGETGVSSGALYTEVPVEPRAETAPVPAPPTAPEPASVEDPYLAQMALSLTEVSLELTAEATLLARDRKIVAYAGRMPAEEIEELRGTIADDWDAAPGEVRIRFITAQGSGKDYMLWSRRTEDDLTLSLIFAGTTPLRDIRRQGKRLVDALLSVPEAPAPAPAEVMRAMTTAPVETVTRTPYAWVWLLRDPRAHLDTAVSQAISAGLNVQMREQQWVIQALQVHEDYVYLLADVPGESPAYQIVRDLKRRSAEIAHAQNPTYAADDLWADSYLAVTPGRELDIEEIQQFINFDRME